MNSATRWRALLYSIACAFFSTSNATPIELPSLPTLHHTILQLRDTLTSSTLSQNERYGLYHELHRLLFLMYLLQNDNVHKEARINAHHAFSQLYHLPGESQFARRTLLSRFVSEVCSSGFAPAEDGRFITRVAQLEEGLCPLVLEHPQGQEILFAFSKSACAMTVSLRLTKTHKIMWISSIVVGIGIIIALTRLLNKIVKAEEEFSEAIVKAEERHAGISNAVIQRVQKLGNPTFFERLALRIAGKKLIQKRSDHSISGDTAVDNQQQ